MICLNFWSITLWAQLKPKLEYGTQYELKFVNGSEKLTDDSYNLLNELIMLYLCDSSNTISFQPPVYITSADSFARPKYDKYELLWDRTSALITKFEDNDIPKEKLSMTTCGQRNVWISVNEYAGPPPFLPLRPEDTDLFFPANNFHLSNLDKFIDYVKLDTNAHIEWSTTHFSPCYPTKEFAQKLETIRHRNDSIRTLVFEYFRSKGLVESQFVWSFHSELGFKEPLKVSVRIRENYCLLPPPPFPKLRR